MSRRKNKKRGNASKRMYHRHKKMSIQAVRLLWAYSKSVYERTGFYPVLAIDGGKVKVDMGFMNDGRYENFFSHGTDCVSCGLEGEYFWLETFAIPKSTKGEFYKKKWHFNLYGTGRDGSEVMMTKDHILPKCKGGADSLENYQPMCRKCNGNKGDKVEG